MRLLGRLSSRSPRGARWAAEDLARRRTELLRENDLFQDLDETEMDRIAERLPMATSQPGELIYAPGETGEALFILKAGRVWLYRIAPNGRKLVLATVGPGTAFGEMAFLGQSMTGSFAEAVDECTLCIMSRVDIEQIMLEHPKVAVRLMRLLSSKLREAEDRLEQMAFAPLTARLARLLLNLDRGSEVSGYSHQELAELLGISRETVSRAMVDFKTAGWITVDRRCIRLLDRTALGHVAETADC
ncbi:MAG: Crp/Fnr family transcriptional regulator [Tepidiformaceae bacterium]